MPPSPPFYITAMSANSPSHILSFDIGTRHLAYCALKHPPNAAIQTDGGKDHGGTTAAPAAPTPPVPTLTHWAVVDLLAVPGTPYDEACVHVLVKSWRCPALRQYLEERHLPTHGKRAELQARILADLKARSVSKVTSSNLCVLATKMYAYLDTQPWMLECDVVVLENQPCLTNPTMKSVQMLLYGYFMYRGVWCKHVTTSCSGSAPLPRVMMTSATNKLKVCGEAWGNDAGIATGAEPTSLEKSLDTNLATVQIPFVTEEKEQKEKGDEMNDESKTPGASSARTSYKTRKKDAIALANRLLALWQTLSPSDLWDKWRALLAQSCAKEQDDLSDCLLQGIYVMVQHTLPAKRRRAKTKSRGKSRGAAGVGAQMKGV